MKNEEFVCVPLSHGNSSFFILNSSFIYSYATFSRRFMTEKMNRAANKQSTINVPQTTHKGRSPHNHEATEVK